MALGVALALLYVRGTMTRTWIVGLVHGVVGAGGFGMLLLALQGPRHGDAMGAGSFGFIAAVLFGLALACGPLIPLLARRRPHVAGVLIATHGSLATAAFVLFLAWSSM